MIKMKKDELLTEPFDLTSARVLPSVEQMWSRSVDWNPDWSFFSGIEATTTVGNDFWIAVKTVKRTPRRKQPGFLRLHGSPLPSPLSPHRPLIWRLTSFSKRNLHDKIRHGLSSWLNTFTC